MAKSLSAFILLVSPAEVAWAREGLQSQRDYEAALENFSSAPSYVLITAADGRSGVERTGCILATMLVGAVLRERHLAFSPASIREAQRIAGASLNHRFVFHEEAALRNLGFDHADARNEEACRLIRAGHPAFMDDRSGQTFPGQPASLLPTAPAAASPDSPNPNISFVGSLGRQDALVTIGLVF